MRIASTSPDIFCPPIVDTKQNGHEITQTSVGKHYLVGGNTAEWIFS